MMLGRPCACRTTSSALNPYCTAQRDQHRATAGVESTKTPSRSKRMPRVCTSTGLGKESVVLRNETKLSHAYAHNLELKAVISSCAFDQWKEVHRLRIPNTAGHGCATCSHARPTLATTASACGLSRLAFPARFSLTWAGGRWCAFAGRR